MSNRVFRFGVAAIAVLAQGCNSHAYYGEAMQYHALAREVLVSHGVCSGEQDCQRKSLLFAEGGELSLGVVSWGGANITLYETNDSGIVEEISVKFKRLHEQLHRPKVTLTVFSSKHLKPKVKFRTVVVQ